ncbi:MAG: excinuclease ABC subunit UvrC [Bacteroidota bacterium]
MQSTYYSVSQRNQLPDKPGIYLFYNAQNKIIYVGKAKNLKKRVASYFKLQSPSTHIKTKKMVSQVIRIGLVLVNSEYEALLLENNFIKQNQPRYNALLKDSKSYPYLCITNERFPRLITTRQQNLKLGIYFGPFTNKNTLREIQELVRELFPIRTCTYHLSQENIAKKKYKVCLEYHLGNCLGPCEGLQKEVAYNEDMEQVKKLLKGHFKSIKTKIKSQMLAAAKSLDFRKAASYKQKLEAIARYTAKSLITRIEVGKIDVIAIVENEQKAFVNYLHINNGMMVFAQTIEIEKKLQERAEDLLALALCHFRQKSQSQAKKVYANIAPAVVGENLELIVPQIGEKKELVELAIKNALFFKQEQLHKKVEAGKTSRSTLMLLQQDLRLAQIPMHIECFDNSNLQGTNPVAAMVCFKKGRPAKTAYRHFHVKTVEGPNDVASMHEIIKRRYEKLVEQKNKLPDLIIIDGGKGQLNAAVEVLKKLGIYGQVAIVSIAKKLEEIYYPNDPHPLHISKKSLSLQLLQKIRDEAHRFAITFHRQIRSKQSLESELETLAGIGPQTVEKLIAYFGNLANIKKASLIRLADQVGHSKAKLLYDYFH